MRRFLIWSGLAALVGLVLAVIGVWAYGHFYARFQPVTIDRNQAEVESLLQQASWIADAEGGEPPVYVVGAHDDAMMRTWLDEEADKVRAAGAQVRVIVFLPQGQDGKAGGSPAERATLAQLWLGRDPMLLQQWLDTPRERWRAPGIPAADGNLARTAVARASGQFFDDLSDLLGRAGVRVGRPLVIWRDREGFLKACACSDRRSWAFVRDDLNAPDAIGTDEPVPATPAVPDVEEAEETPGATAQPSTAMPYPVLPAPVAPSAAQPVQATPPTASRPTPPSRLERQTVRPRPAPPAKKREPSRPKPPEEEDTRFY